MVLYTCGPTIPLNCAIAFVNPMPIPEATVPSNALILSGQMIGYAEPAQATATIRKMYLTTGLETVKRTIYETTMAISATVNTRQRI